MEPTNDLRVRELLLEAMEKSSRERPGFLDQACGEDRQLRHEIDSLLAGLERATDFMALPTMNETAPAAAPVASEHTESPGMQIGRYKLLQLIGEGGFGSVFMAEQQHPIKRRVALKIIKLGMDTKQVIARFEAERQALAMMDHPNIAKVLDAGATGTGRPYFVMELVRGVPITEYCDENKLSTHQRLELFMAVCRAVHHAHQKGIIHRDIKPNNILVTLNDGAAMPRVIDFGIAKATNARLTEQTYFTEYRQLIGTPEYMPPEQAQMSLQDVDTRSDIYALGVLLYELLTGSTPFEATKLRSMAYEQMQKTIREAEPPKPSTRLSTLGAMLATVAAHRSADARKLRQQVRGELDWIVMKCLEKARDRRYDSAADLAADVQRHLDDEPIMARAPGRIYQFKKLVRRHKLGFAAAASVVAALVLGFGMAMYGLIRAKIDRNIAIAARIYADEQKTLAENRAQEAHLRFAEGLVSQGDALSLAGHWLQARDRYVEAYTRLIDLKRPVFLAEIGIWDTYRNAPDLLRFAGHSDEIRSVAISPDGRTAISGSADNTLKLWDLCTGREIRTLRGHTDRVLSVAISPDGRTALSGSTDCTLRLWDLASGNPLATLTGHSAEIRSVAFSPDGRTALAGSESEDTTVKLWDLRTRKVLRPFIGHTARVVCVAFSSDGRLALSGSDDKTLKLWDVSTGHELQTFAGHTDTVRAVAISADGGMALSGSGDHTLKLWDLKTGDPLCTFKGHRGPIAVAAFSPDGQSAASGSYDGTIKIWDLGTGEDLRTIRAHSRAVAGLAFSPDGQMILSGSWDKSLKLWDIGPDIEARALRGHAGEVNSVVFSPDGRMALSGGDDWTVRLWDLSTGRELRRLSGHSVLSVALSPDGQKALIARQDKTIRLWDLMAMKEIRVLHGHSGAVTTVAFSPDGRTVLSGSEDKMLKLWDLSSGREVRSFSGHSEPVRSVAFSPDGRTALSGSNDQTLRFWDLDTGQQLCSFYGHLWGVFSVAFSPDGNTALSGGYDGAVKLWDVRAGKELRTLGAHSKAVTSVDVSPDGRTAVSGGRDHCVKLWDLSTGRELRTLDGHSGSVRSVAFSRDGRVILSASDDKTIRVWDFFRGGRYLEFESQLAAASGKSPSDPAALMTLGNWYAFRGQSKWAVELLEKAQAGGADVPAITLARCYWELGRTEDARRCFQRALKSAENPQDGFYLGLCLQALDGPVIATDSSDVCWSFLLVGVAHYRAGHAERAIEYALRGLAFPLRSASPAPCILRASCTSTAQR